MKKLKLLFSFFLFIPVLFGQSSWESGIGYNRTFDNLNAGYNGFQLNSCKRYGYTLNFAYNFRENKLFSPKLGLTYNYDFLAVDYGMKNDYLDEGYVIYKRRLKDQSHLLKLNLMMRLNLFEIGSIKISPQIGFNINFACQTKKEEFGSATTYKDSLITEHSASYSDAYLGFAFDVEAITALHFEKRIQKNLSFLLDLNYVRKFNSGSEFYNAKNEFRLVAGIKKNITSTITDKDKRYLFISGSGFSNFYSFERNEDYDSYHYDGTYLTSTSNNYKELSLSQKGFSLNFSIVKKKFYYSNELSFSTINFKLDCEKNYSSSPKMFNPFFVNSGGQNLYQYAAKKREFEYALKVGYDLLNNKRLSFIPQIGLGFLVDTKFVVNKDYAQYHSHSEYNFFNQPEPEYVVEDTTVYGKASDKIQFNSPATIYAKIGFLTAFNISSRFNLNFQVNKLFISFGHISFDNIYDRRRYQLSLGLSYLLKTV